MAIGNNATAQVSPVAGNSAFDGHAELRAKCVDVFAAEYANGTVTLEQRAKAEKVLKLFIEDSVETVRAAVAKNVAACPFLPKDLALTIASDVDAVAVPLISASEVFDDEDLIAIVRSGVTAKQIATASRSTVSTEVSSVLVETGKRQVIAELLGNDGAEIFDEDLTAIVDNFGDDTVVESRLAGRVTLPANVLEKLLEVAGVESRKILESVDALPSSASAHVSRLVHEQLIVSNARHYSDETEMSGLVSRLAGQGRLSATLALRALCKGELDLFCACLAEASNADASTIAQSIERGHINALQKLYRDADWPEESSHAYMAVLREYLGSMSGETSITPEQFAERAAQRLTREFADLNARDIEGVLAELFWRVS